jgi:histidinol-phosphate phosphatase family protein
MTSKAVFLDRDGTICEEVNYLSNIEQVKIYPGVFEAIAKLNKNDLKVIIITNQSGVARGYFTLKSLLDVNDYIVSELKKNGAIIDAIYFCPHHPDSQCGCRKPKTGLIEKAAHDNDLDLSASFMVGDKLIDVETGKRAGCRTVLVLTGYGRKMVEEIDISNIHPDHIAQDLNDAALWIVDLNKNKDRRTGGVDTI